MSCITATISEYSRTLVLSYLLHACDKGRIHIKKASCATVLLVIKTDVVIRTDVVFKIKD